MKKALFVLLVAAIVAPVMLFAQASPAPSAADSQAAVANYGKSLNSSGVTMNLILLNDKTIDVLFQAPTKFAMRARARMATMVYVQGTPGKDVDLKLNFTIQQGGDPVAGKPVNIKNFDNMKVAKGARIDGVVEFPTKVDLTKSFKIANGSDSVEFKLSEDAVKALGS
jgi:hypothetical protein